MQRSELRNGARVRTKRLRRGLEAATCGPLNSDLVVVLRSHLQASPLISYLACRAACLKAS